MYQRISLSGIISKLRKINKIHFENKLLKKLSIHCLIYALILTIPFDCICWRKSGPLPTTIGTLIMFPISLIGCYFSLKQIINLENKKIELLYFCLWGIIAVLLLSPPFTLMLISIAILAILFILSYRYTKSTISEIAHGFKTSPSTKLTPKILLIIIQILGIALFCCLIFVPFVGIIIILGIALLCYLIPGLLLGFYFFRLKNCDEGFDSKTINLILGTIIVVCLMVYSVIIMTIAAL